MVKISFVTVSVVDKNGIPCPTATNQLNLKLKEKEYSGGL